MWSENAEYHMPPKWLFMYGKYTQFIILCGYLGVPSLHPKPDNFKEHQKKVKAAFIQGLSQKIKGTCQPASLQSWLARPPPQGILELGDSDFYSPVAAGVIFALYSYMLVHSTG